MKKKLKYVLTLIVLVLALIIGYVEKDSTDSVSGDTAEIARTVETDSDAADQTGAADQDTGADQAADSSQTDDSDKTTADNQASDADQTAADNQANDSDKATADDKANGSDKTTNAEQTDTSDIREDGTYTSKDEVAAYIHLYGHLPDNYITKNEAKALGWVNSEGNLGKVAPGKSIGGDHYGNYEGTLPEKSGRSYTECDIDTNGSYRGAKRIVFSNDGLIYYTEDHYETFELLYGEE